MNEVRDRAIGAFREHALSWGRIEQGMSAEVDDLVAVVTGSPLALMNRIVATSMPADPESALHKTRELIEAHPVPYAVEVFPGAEGLVELLAAEGYQEAARLPFMVHPDSANAQAPGVDGIVERIPETLEELTAWSLALVEGFGMPAELAATFAWPEILEASDWRVFSGLRDGAVVGTSWACFGNGATGVFSVSTIESERRRGLGAALTVAAMRAGVDAGDDIAYLQASEMGYPVYEKLGFVATCDSILYTRAPAEG